MPQGGLTPRAIRSDIIWSLGPVFVGGVRLTLVPLPRVQALQCNVSEVFR